MPNELWYSLGRTISPDYATQNDRGTVRVPLERFLARRQWLGQLLDAYGCEITFDHGVQTVLRRAAEERAAYLTRRLQGAA